MIAEPCFCRRGNPAPRMPGMLHDRGIGCQARTHGLTIIYASERAMREGPRFYDWQDTMLIRWAVSQRKSPTDPPILLEDR